MDHAKEKTFHGYVLQDDPGASHWVSHLQPMPLQSRCTLGISYLQKVKGIFAKKCQILEKDVILLGT